MPLATFPSEVVQTTQSTDYSVDGISNQAIVTNGAFTNMYPSSEMLSEFKVSSVNNNAEFGSVGDVLITTKSGGNQVHGSGFEYLQNREFGRHHVWFALPNRPSRGTHLEAASADRFTYPGYMTGETRRFSLSTTRGIVVPDRSFSKTRFLQQRCALGTWSGVPGGAAVGPHHGRAISEQRQSRLSRAESVGYATCSKVITRCRTPSAPRRWRFQ